MTWANTIPNITFIKARAYGNEEIIQFLRKTVNQNRLPFVYVNKLYNYVISLYKPDPDITLYRWCDTRFPMRMIFPMTWFLSIFVRYNKLIMLYCQRIGCCSAEITINCSAVVCVFHRGAEWTLNVTSSRKLNRS